MYGFNERRRHSSNTAIPSRKSPGPMTIPNGREDIAPPPLPPPKYIEELTYDDAGWQSGSTMHAGFGKSTLAPIKLGSSLMGSYGREGWEGMQDKVERKDFFRRGSFISAVIRLPSEAEIKMESVPTPDELLSASSFGNHQFHGENELSQKILGPSSNAYDKQLLSKIGKPSSPPRLPGFGDGGPVTWRLPFHSKDGNKFKSLSMPDVSPRAKPNWGKDYMDYRSPSVDSNAPSSTIDADQYAYSRSGSRMSASESLVGDSSPLPSRSNRGSYDHPSLLDPDADFPMDEMGGPLGKLHLDDRTPPQSGGYSPLSKQGMKRRASSPRQNSRDVKQQLHPVSSIGDLYQPRISGQPFGGRSPNNRYPQGSVSSTSSASLRNGSLASSAALSIGSSVTSISSLDRYSTGGVSSNSVLDFVGGIDSPYLTPVSLNPSRRGSLSTSKPLQSSSDAKSAAATRKVNAKHMNETFMCQCCPKKPKKLDTLEDLHLHEMEKQYTCQFCQNRFKNKNEAERHQNSLHLRRHSWSCAVIGVRYQDSFYPSISPSFQSANGPSADACGFCGEEFANFPQPDWYGRE